MPSYQALKSAMAAGLDVKRVQVNREGKILIGIEPSGDSPGGLFFLIGRYWTVLTPMPNLKSGCGLI